jgi:hypothetical protein
MIAAMLLMYNRIKISTRVYRKEFCLHSFSSGAVRWTIKILLLMKGKLRCGAGGRCLFTSYTRFPESGVKIDARRLSRQVQKEWPFELATRTIPTSEGTTMVGDIACPHYTCSTIDPTNPSSRDRSLNTDVSYAAFLQKIR